MLTKRSTVQLSRLLIGSMNRNYERVLNQHSRRNCDLLLNLLIRRGFKSPNVLHHKKDNHIPFYRAVERVTIVLFPLVMVLAYVKVESPSSFIGNVFGFRQFSDTVEDLKDESVRKKKKIKRFVDPDRRPYD